MRIVFASHTAEVGVFRVGSHHLARELARRGHSVTHLSTPTSVLHLARAKDPQIRSRLKLSLRGPATDAAGVVHVEPLLAAPLGVVPPRLRARALKLALRPWRSSSVPERPDVLIIDQPLLGPPLIELLAPRRVVYRPTDAHFDPVLREAELDVLRRADALVATSEPVLDAVSEGADAPLRTLILENGVEFERFVSGETARAGVVYLGALDHRFDWNAVRTLASAFPSVPFRLAGPTPKDVGPMPPNVELLGPVPYADAPDLLAHSSVGLLPLSDDPGNAGRSPMKYFEYLAAGLRIVSSSSPALRSRAAPGVWLYDDVAQAEAGLRAALEAALAGPNESGSAFAEAYGWHRRAGDLLAFLDGVMGAPGRSDG
ncbi:glycosyltransferase [Rathayibacter sp. SD072]|uniref:glycosyltransferase family protein n=1 Tax=Rathayibacter sp. SD072 TaxID=2781731 RepID=UPI001A976FA4|nr:glycosyltransferase [Rathayibacter sp. SD072]MBO0982881.1 glycosyltransferase [Rathayibacter sp. SD072]